MRILMLFVFVSLFASCKKTTGISELVKYSEKIQVVFTEGEGRYTEITAKSEIRRFTKYISDEDTPFYTCGYDGYMLYFTEFGQVRMEFNLEEDCQHVVYSFNEGVQTKKLTPEGLRFLRDLKNN